jgi:hypothetical protein
MKYDTAQQPIAPKFSVGVDDKGNISVPPTYHCSVCRDYGVIAVDADRVVACRSCDPQERIARSRAAMKARIEAATGRPFSWPPLP